MKKYISLLALALVFGVMTSCDSDPSDTDTNPGGTAVKKMCGDWVVTAYTCENQGDVANIDNWEWEELGSFSNYLLTYNTAANKSTEMWVDDNGELALSETDDYSHKVKVNVKYGKRTFSVENAANEYSDNAITIIGGGDSAAAVQQYARLGVSEAGDNLIIFSEKVFSVHNAPLSKTFYIIYTHILPVNRYHSCFRRIFHV